MRFLLAASLLSGVAALNYELLWLRKLTLVAGSTQAAISSVLAAYFLGLALGNVLAGRIADRLRRPLVVYAAAELLIGVWALVFGPALAAFEDLHARAVVSLPIGSPLIHALRLGGAAVLLLLPTTAMGATLPLLAQFARRDVEEASRRSAWLYGVNTLGAMLGAFTTGFYLIEHFGVSRPLVGTALLNVACAALVLPLWRRTRLDGESSRRTPLPPLSPLAVALLVAFAALGFANIAAEVVWTRTFALIFWNDTYIFTTILLLYLFGIGAGSLAGGAALRRVRRPLFALGSLQLVSAAWTAGMIFVVPQTARVLGFRGEAFGVLLRSYFVTVAVGILPQTLVMGATFPLLVRAATAHARQVGGIVGRALAWNTIGGVAGALVAGFVILEHLGLAAGLLLVAVLTALVGLALCVGSREGRRRSWAPALIFLAVLLALAKLPTLPDSLVAMHFPPHAGMRILETRPSVHGTVTVTEESSGERRIWINGSWVARETGHTAQGYIPWIFHGGDVRSALGICFGTGRTFGALLHAGVAELDLVDINAAVIDLSRHWFARSNFGVIDSPAARIVVADGRTFVRYGHRRYDLVTLEPLQMHTKGVVSFYTEEFYREAKARMEPGAVLSQWMPLYLVSPHEFRSLLRTFVSVFPNSLLWGRGPEMMLLGFNVEGAAPAFDTARMGSRLASPWIASELEREWIFEDLDLLLYAQLDGPAMGRLAADGDVYTDDRPTLEFTAPRSHHSLRANLAAVYENLVPLTSLFDLPNPQVAALLEEMRGIQFDVFLGGMPTSRVQPRMAEFHARIREAIEKGPPAQAAEGPQSP